MSFSPLFWFLRQKIRSKTRPWKWRQELPHKLSYLSTESHSNGLSLVTDVVITSNPIKYSYIGILKSRFCYVKKTRILNCAASNFFWNFGQPLELRIQLHLTKTWASDEIRILVIILNSRTTLVSYLEVPPGRRGVTEYFPLIPVWEGLIITLSNFVITLPAYWPQLSLPFRINFVFMKEEKCFERENHL